MPARFVRCRSAVAGFLQVTRESAARECVRVSHQDDADDDPNFRVRRNGIRKSDPDPRCVRGAASREPAGLGQGSSRSRLDFDAMSFVGGKLRLKGDGGGGLLKKKKKKKKSKRKESRQVVTGGEDERDGGLPSTSGYFIKNDRTTDKRTEVRHNRSHGGSQLSSTNPTLPRVPSSNARPFPLPC